MSANVERLEAVMAFIKAHPEQHRQALWVDKTNYSCGTVACLAGWAAEMYAEQEGYQRLTNSGEIWMTPDGFAQHVEQIATDLLGLGYDDREQLFNSTNSRDMLELMVKDLANGEELRSVHEYEKEVGSNEGELV